MDHISSWVTFTKSHLFELTKLYFVSSNRLNPLVFLFPISSMFSATSLMLLCLESWFFILEWRPPYKSNTKYLSFICISYLLFQSYIDYLKFSTTKLPLRVQNLVISYLWKHFTWSQCSASRTNFFSILNIQLKKVTIDSLLNNLEQKRNFYCTSVLQTDRTCGWTSYGFL